MKQLNRHQAAFKFILFCAFGLTGIPVLAQLDEVDTTSLEDSLKKLHSETGLVGVGATVLVDGKVIASAATGLRSADRKVAVTPDDIWHHGSITKSMTATAIGTLVDAGHVNWDDTLDVLLPELSESMHQDWKAITLLDLLTHNAGAPANLNLMEKMTWPTSTEDTDAARGKAVARILATRPVPKAKRKFSYSNVGYIIAGYAASKKAGKPWETWIQEILFDPLELNTAGFGPPNEVNSNNPEQPVGHVRLLVKNFPRGYKDRADNTPILGPAGTVHMSMRDLAHYGWLHLRGEIGKEGLLVSPATFKKLHTAVSNNYACGWVRLNREWAGGDLLFHNGSNTMWYSLLIVLPKKNAVMVFVANDSRLEVAEKAFFQLAKELVK